MAIQKEIIEAEVRLKGMSDVQRQLVEMTSTYGTLGEKNKMLKHRMLELEAEGKRGGEEWKNLRQEVKTNTIEMGKLDAKMGLLSSQMKYSEMTGKQLQKVQRELQKEFLRTSKELQPEKWEELNSKMKEVETQMGKTSAGANSTSKWMTNMKDGFRNLLPVAGIAAGVALLKSAFSAIWDLGKVMQGDAMRSSVVLGNQLGYVEEQADKLASKMGLTNREFVAGSAAIADLLVPLGFTREAAAKMAVEVEGLAGSLNEWTGGRYGVTEVSSRLQRAILGETDSLKELGISIRLDSKEYTNSVKEKQKSLGVSEQQAQAMTIMSMLYQKSTDAQAAYTQKGNALLRFENWLSVTWKKAKDRLVEYITTSSDQRLLKSADGIIRQGEEVKKTNEQIGTLVTRYEELRKKGKLSKDEQLEMNKAVKQLADFAPGAISQVDAYGNAMGISAGRIREAMESQRLLNVEMQKDVSSKVMDKLQDRITDANKKGRHMRDQIAFANEHDAAWYKKRSMESNIAGAKAGFSSTPEQERLQEGVRTRLAINASKEANEDVAKYVLTLQKLGKTNAEIATEAGASWEWLDGKVKQYMSTIPQDTASNGGKSKAAPDSTKAYSVDSDPKYLKDQLSLKQQLRKGDLADEEAYQQKELDLKIKYTQQRLALGADKDVEKAKLKIDLEDMLLQQQKQHDFELDKDKDYLKKKADLQKQFIIGEITDDEVLGIKLLQIEVEAYNNRIATGKDKGKSLTDLQEQLNEKEVQLKKQSIEKQKKLQDKVDEDDVKSIETFFIEKDRKYNKDLANVKARHKQELDAVGGNGKKKKELQVKQNEEEINLTKGHLTDIEALINKLMATGALPDIKLIDTILSEKEKEELLKRFKEAIDAKSKLSSTSAPTEADRQAGLNAPDAGGKTDILGFSADDWIGFSNNVKNGENSIAAMAMGAQALVAVWQTYSNLMTQIENRQLQKAEKENNKKKQSLKKQLDSKLITETQYNNQVAALDEQLDQKKADIAVKQAKREKAISIMSAMVNTAVAITAALKAGPILGPILAGIIAALGAAQIAMILATPIPGREKGGYLVQREQDGKSFNAEFQPRKRGFIGKPTVIVGEGAGTEWVANDKAVKNPTVAPILNLFDEAQRNGSIASIDMNRVLADRFAGRESGGTLSGGAIPVASSSDPALIEALNRSSQIIGQLEIRLRKPFTGIVGLTGKEGFIEKMEEFDAWTKDINV